MVTGLGVKKRRAAQHCVVKLAWTVNHHVEEMKILPEMMTQLLLPLQILLLVPHQLRAQLLHQVHHLARLRVQLQVCRLVPHLAQLRVQLLHLVHHLARLRVQLQVCHLVPHLA